MGYFSYHGKIKNLIADNHLTAVEMVANWNGIKPAMVLYFDNNKPMPVREHRFDEYAEIFKHINIEYKTEWSVPQYERTK